MSRLPDLGGGLSEGEAPNRPTGQAPSAAAATSTVWPFDGFCVELACLEGNLSPAAQAEQARLRCQ